MEMRKSIVVCVSVMVVLASVGVAKADLNYVIGFEPPTYTASEAQDSVGVLAGQGGWSGGAIPGFTNDNYEVDNGDGTYGNSKVTTVDFHTGSQSWRFSRGYANTQGAPFSPILDGSVGAPGSGADFNTMTATIWFKAVDPSGDNSTMNIYQGSVAGDDRTGFNVYLTSTSSGINVGTYRWNSTFVWEWEDLATGLALDQWHSVDIAATFTDDFVNDHISYSINGGAASTGNTWTHPYREAYGYAYTPGNSLMFNSSHGDNLAFKGFYFDDISYAASGPNVVIPAPGSFILGAVGIGIAGWVRKKRIAKAS